MPGKCAISAGPMSIIGRAALGCNASSGTSGFWWPLNIVLTLITGGIRITFTPFPGAETEVWISINGGAYTLITTLGLNINTYDYLHDPGVDISVKLRSKIDTTVLNIPNTLAAADLSSGIVRVTWLDNNTEASLFELWANIAGGGFSLLATILPGVQLYDHNVGQGVNVIYKIRAKEGTLPIYSGYSSTVTITSQVWTSVPTVSTTAISALLAITASSGGNVTSDGGASVTARGVCWSLSANPTISDSKTSDGTGTGVFSSNLTGLSSNKTYHVRAYATNSIGTAYGADVQFTTTHLLYDTFTDTNGVRLKNHTMDIGAGWSEPNEPTGQWSISGNKAILSANGLWCQAVAEGGRADIDISIEVAMPAYANYAVGICFRFQDVSNYWALWISRTTNGTPKCSLYAFPGGTTNAVDITQEDNVTHILRLVVNGNDLKGYWNGVVGPQLTSTLLNDKTKHGLSQYMSNSPVYPNAPIDNFIADTL